MHRLQAAGGCFGWSRAGWFAGQLGATAWLLAVGAWLWADGLRAGAVVMALGLAPNALGALLWQGRRALNPHPAMQLLLAAAGLSALWALLYLRRAGVAVPLAAVTSVAVAYPAVMAWLALQQRASPQGLRVR